MIFDEKSTMYSNSQRIQHQKIIFITEKYILTREGQTSCVNHMKMVVHGA